MYININMKLVYYCIRRHNRRGRPGPLNILEMFDKSEEVLDEGSVIIHQLKHRLQVEHEYFMRFYI